MRICYLGFISSIHIQRWTRWFAERGHEVHLVSAEGPWNSKIHDEFEKIGIKLHRVIIPQRSFYRFLPRKSRYAGILAYRRIIREINPDIVHGHYLTYYGLPTALSGNYPKVLSAWGSDIIADWRSSLLLKLIVKISLKKADVITCTSNYLCDLTSKLAPNNAKIIKIPFGIDINYFDPSRYSIKKTECHTIGIAKYLKPVYGYEYLLKALHIIKKVIPNIQLLIAGKGQSAYEKELKKLAENLDISDNIKWMGEIEHNEMPKFLAKLDVFVMPSLSESFGVAALEAEAMELPVVSTNVGGIPEVVKHNNTGLLVKPKDSKRLAEAIIKLLRDKKLCKEMGKAGRKFVEENYDWNKNAEIMLKVYEKLIE